MSSLRGIVLIISEMNNNCNILQMLFDSSPEISSVCPAFLYYIIPNDPQTLVFQQPDLIRSSY